MDGIFIDIVDLSVIDLKFHTVDVNARCVCV